MADEQKVRIVITRAECPDSKLEIILPAEKADDSLWLKERLIIHPRARREVSVYSGGEPTEARAKWRPLVSVSHQVEDLREHASSDCIECKGAEPCAQAVALWGELMERNQVALALLAED